MESLIQIGEKLNLKWVWNDEGEDIGDETNYFQTRNFKTLQISMLEWLKSVAKAVLDLGKDDSLNIKVSMPCKYPSIVGDYFFMSPLGFFSRDWLQEIVTCELSDLIGKGVNFFPWWEKDCGADFYYKCGLTTAWIDLPWHTYDSDYELEQYQFVLDCFKRAKELDRNIQLPETEIELIRLYMKNDIAAPAPEPEGIGFHKRMMIMNTTGEWTIQIPGYYYHLVENDGEIVVFWFGGRTIRINSMSIKDPNGQSVPAEKIIEKHPDKSSVIKHSEDYLLGCATIERTMENGEEFWLLSGMMATSGNLCIVTISYEKTEDEDWAIATWKSITMPKPDYD